MNLDRFDRTARLVGIEGMEAFAQARVAVFGLGGVGSFCAEALARSSIGYLRITDHDAVAESNCNRQLEALGSTIGKAKVEVLGDRLADINPQAVIDRRREFFHADKAEGLLDGGLNFVVDAIDAMGPKIELLHQCVLRGIPVVTALGAGGRTDPTLVRIAALAETRNDRFGARVRKMLRRRCSLDLITAVYSEELAHEPKQGPWERVTEDLVRGRQRVIQPSMVMVPAAFGMAAAHVVVRDLLRRRSPGQVH